MNKLIVITGATACGKTRLRDHLLKVKKGIEKFITSTTRDPRNGETNGYHYWFRLVQDFLLRVSQGEFFEHEEVFSGVYYGMEYAEIQRIQKNGNIPIVVLDVKGAKKIMNDDTINSLIIFLSVPEETLWERFLKSITLGERKGDSVSPEERRERMKIEIEAKEQFFFVVNNIDFETAVEEANYLISDFLRVKNKKVITQIG